MSACCDTIENLGCVGMCEVINTSIVASLTGEYIISTVTGGGVLTLDLTVGEVISFTNIFNEDSITIFTIKDPNGNLVERNGAECFQVKVNAGADFTEIDDECTCAQRLFLLLNDHTMNMDLTTPINFMNVLVQGVGIVNLPNISDVAEQDGQVRLITLSTSNLTVNPGATDDLGLGVGIGTTGPGVAGRVGIFTIQSAHVWAFTSQLIPTI